MCKVSDLLVMAVDSDQKGLEVTCASLNRLGINKIICVESYSEAVNILKDNSDVDIVIADFAIEAGKALGLLLCSTFKKKLPGVVFVLVSKEYSCSVAVHNLHSGNVDDMLDKNESEEMEDLMKKWVFLAQQRNTTREIFNGKLSSK